MRHRRPIPGAIVCDQSRQDPRTVLVPVADTSQAAKIAIELVGDGIQLI